MRTVLIIDPDLGFVFWLGRQLLSGGYNAFPAKGVSEAAVLIRKLELEVDLLIVNASLAGVRDLLNTLRQSRPSLKVLALAGDAPGEPHPLERPDAIMRKPRHTDHLAGSVWLRSVEHLLARDCMSGSQSTR